MCLTDGPNAEIQAAAQQSVFQAEGIFCQSDQRAIHSIKVFQDEDSVPRVLEAQINGPAAVGDWARVEELAMTKLNILSFYPLERLLKLHYRNTPLGLVNIDFDTDITVA
ncbi:MAG: hypothetical protein Q9208_007503 [Pyrenodesmia sp. 3 TL-2023]